jgi:8-oxo-dGTP pyrophosphatase MutT (NUDIX family)
MNTVATIQPGTVASSAPALFVSPSRAGALVVSGDRILLMLARKYAASPLGNWSIPKGRIDPGETAWETALRELREECGLDLSDSSCLPEGVGRLGYLRKGKPVGMEVYLYRLAPALLDHLREDSHRLRHRCREVAEARLVTLREAMDLITPSQIPLLEHAFGVRQAAGRRGRHPQS